MLARLLRLLLLFELFCYFFLGLLWVKLGGDYADSLRWVLLSLQRPKKLAGL